MVVLSSILVLWLTVHLNVFVPTQSTPTQHSYWETDHRRRNHVLSRAGENVAYGVEGESPPNRRQYGQSIQSVQGEEQYMVIRQEQYYINARGKGSKKGKGNNSIKGSKGSKGKNSSKKSKGKKSGKKNKGKNGGGDSGGIDLSNCASYANDWIIDLAETCDADADPLNGNWDGCRCDDARNRIRNGEIDCRRDTCPDNCEACKSCLYYVEDCIDYTTLAPTPEPTRPTPITRQPTPSRTRQPVRAPPISTSSPTPGGFSINRCNSYSNDWTLDLGSTCSGNFLNNDYTDCDCIQARERLAAGEIDCNVDRPCPDDCFVCQVCLYYVLQDLCIPSRDR